tara:strand:+ start:77 stop:517 length:441 start_codon:yes stop_codon:yes gene_type:complete
MPIKTFRGQIAHNTEDTIVLHTNNGSTGYKIIKFEVMPADVADAGGEHLCKIYSLSGTTIDNSVDFSDQTLLAAAIANNSSSVHIYGLNFVSIFDNRIVNQDIYVTHWDNDSGRALNYYIEMEQIKLDLNQNTVATLKDIRNIEGQ